MRRNRNGIRFYDTGYLVAVSAMHGFPSAFGDSALTMLRHHIQGSIRMAGLRGGLPNLGLGGLLEHLLLYLISKQGIAFGSPTELGT